jgi:phage head maturation protease
LNLADAAAARALKTRELSDRPRERWASRDSGAPRGWIPAVQSRVRVEHAAKGGSTEGTVRFEGFASVTGQFYEMYDMFGPYKEKVHVGSFVESLGKPDLSTPLVLNHDSLRRMAETRNQVSPLQLSEVVEGDTTGLWNNAPTLQLSGKFADPDVAYIVPKLTSGLVDEMSFRFMITAGEWSEDFTEFHIHSVDIHRGDTSIVGYGANPLTTGAGLRAPADLTMEGKIMKARLLADNGRYRNVS